MDHKLIQEIRYDLKWLKWRKEEPTKAVAFLNKIQYDLDWQWPNFLYYKEIKRKEPRTEMRIGNGRETAVMPEAYKLWMVYTKPEEISSKVWTTEFIRQHPELWLDGYKWGKRRQELR